jgi:hypothetical protein
MNWFWMNIPLMAAFFVAWTGIPLWMVVKHRHWGPDPAARYGNPELQAVMVGGQGDAANAADLQAAAVPGCRGHLRERQVLVADVVSSAPVPW